MKLKNSTIIVLCMAIFTINFILVSYIANMYATCTNYTNNAVDSVVSTMKVEFLSTKTPTITSTITPLPYVTYTPGPHDNWNWSFNK